MTFDEIKALGEDYEVCPCMSHTLGEVLEAIKEGSTTVETLIENTDVGSACELCISCKNDEDSDRVIHLDEILEYSKKINYNFS